MQDRLKIEADNLAPNANVVKDVLTKGEAKAAAGTAAQGGIAGKIDCKVWPLRKEALNSDRFKTGYTERNASNLFTGRIKLSKKSLRRSLKHCANEEEISALQYVW